jgi:hypothetical protein
MRRMILIASIASLLISTTLPSTSWAIDVMVKGIDDGVKTNKQQDYLEAVMNAKLQAMERAGVEIFSVTRVVNFQTKYDMVESKAEAVLGPGFQIIDIGYSEDGSYLVVLSARVRTVKDMLKEKREVGQKTQNVERTKNLRAEIGQREVQVTELRKSIADKEEESWREEQAMIHYWKHQVEKCKEQYFELDQVNKRDKCIAQKKARLRKDLLDHHASTNEWIGWQTYYLRTEEKELDRLTRELEDS